MLAALRRRDGCQCRCREHGDTPCAHGIRIEYLELEFRHVVFGIRQFKIFLSEEDDNPLEKFEDGEHYVVHIAEAGCLNSLRVVMATGPVNGYRICLYTQKSSFQNNNTRIYRT